MLRALVAFLATLLVAATANAQGETNHERLKKDGVATCAEPLGDAIDQLADGRPANFGWMRKGGEANDRAVHGVLLMVNEKRPAAFASVSAVPRADGGCDRLVTWIEFAPMNCADTRAKAEAIWGDDHDLRGTIMVTDLAGADPAAMHLITVPNGCLVVRTAAYWTEKSAASGTAPRTEERPAK